MQGIEPVDVIIHDFDSSKHECFIRGVALGAAVGGELKPSQPAAEADHVGHLLIVKVEHGLFNIRLGANEFFAHSLPVALFAVFEKALAAFGQPVSHSERPRLPDQSARRCLERPSERSAIVSMNPSATSAPKCSEVCSRLS